MEAYLVKTYNWKKTNGWKYILVKEHDKETAKRIVREMNVETPFIVVGAIRVEVNEKGEAYFPPKPPKETKETKPRVFEVSFTKPNGQQKKTTVKALDREEARNEASKWGIVTSVKAVGKTKKNLKPQKNMHPSRTYEEVRGIPIEHYTVEEVQKMIKERSGWTTAFIRTAGSLQSGMTNY